MKINKSHIKKTGILFLVLLALSQFIRIDKTNEPLYPLLDFNTATKAPAEIENILRVSCYDCHSREVKYPWYTNIAPVSWWIKNHIEEGSQHLNFSLWATYSKKRKEKKLEECVEMIEEGEMPMTSYTLIHGEATLSKDQKDKLIQWFNLLRTENKEEEEKED